MALDRQRALRARVRGGTTMRVGLWVDRAGNTGTDRSPEETGCCRALSMREKPDVFGVLRRMGWALGRLRTCEPGCDCGGFRRRNRRWSFCGVLRGTNLAQEVRRGI
jgi:hypothetical protein